MKGIDKLIAENGEQITDQKEELVSRMRSLSADLSFWASEFEEGRKVSDSIAVVETANRIGKLIADIQTAQSVLEALNQLNSAT